jgi:CheY-like chemotaxis protein
MSRKLVLCIEESPEDVELIRRILDHGDIKCRFKAALSPADGLEAARKQRPDLILLDFHLRGGAAWEVMEQIRSDTGLWDVPVVGMMARSFAGEDPRVRLEGPHADEYVMKPVDVDSLLKAVTRILGEENQKK